MTAALLLALALQVPPAPAVEAQADGGIRWTGIATGAGILAGNLVGIPAAYGLLVAGGDPRSCLVPPLPTVAGAFAAYIATVMIGGTAGGTLGGVVDGDVPLGLFSGAVGGLFAVSVTVPVAMGTGNVGSRGELSRDDFLAVSGVAALVGVAGGGVVGYVAANPLLP